MFDQIATAYDRGMAPLERLWLRALRRELLAAAEGRILEVGIGTGANLPFYRHAGCVVGLDESSEMLAAAAARAAHAGRCLDLSRASVEGLPFASGAFDTVVSSLVLCSVIDPHRALSEVRRVLRPGGRLLLLEHTRPDPPLLARLVDLANRPWYAFNGRCHVNRETARAVVEAGLRLERIDNRLAGLLRVITARAE